MTHSFTHKDIPMKWIVPTLAALTLAAIAMGPGPAPDAEPASQREAQEQPAPLVADDQAPTPSEASAPSPEVEDDDDFLAMLDQPLRWHTDYETVLALSERAGKPIFVRFR